MIVKILYRSQLIIIIQNITQNSKITKTAMQQAQQTPSSSPNSPNSLLKWIRQTFYYPNCRKAASMNDLRSGVAVGQILTQILPEYYHQELLANIQVGKQTVDVCVANWRVIKKVMSKYVQQCGVMGIQLKEYTGQALYYRQNQLYKFMADVMYPLWENTNHNNKQQKINHIPNKKQNISYSNTIMAHILQTDQQQSKPTTNKNNNNSNNKVQIQHINPTNNRKDRKQQNVNNINSTNVNLSQLSDIANTSYPNLYQSQHHPGGKIININYQQPQHYIQSQQYNTIPPIPHEHIQQLENWLNNKLQLPPTHQYQPHELLGHLINTIFCSSRLNDYIIKQAHFEHGALFVYRKVLEFLVNNNKAEKISRTNMLDMLKTIEEEGVVRQMQYWRVIQDIHNFDKLKRHHISAVSSTKQSNTNTQKQNISPNMIRKNSNKTLSKCKTSKQSINTHMTNITNSNSYINFKYNIKDIKQAEEWLLKDLGLQHTMSKIYGDGDIWANVLLNGVLAGSILMRLKIGKVILNKSVSSIGEVKKNWDIINKACNLRGYQSFKIITSLLHNIPADPTPKLLINIFLHILNQFRQEHNKKYPTPSQSNYNTINCNNCPPETHIVKSNAQEQTQLKQEITNWLSQVFSIQINKQVMSVGQLTQICRELLNINLYKETTKKIQENNVEKILAEMRRIGLAEYYRMRKEDVMVVEDAVRWRILSDLRWVIDGKIQFCRA